MAEARSITRTLKDRANTSQYRMVLGIHYFHTPSLLYYFGRISPASPLKQSYYLAHSMTIYHKTLRG